MVLRMHGMWGSPGVAGHRVISAGTVLVVGAGLALYQMTSLVLGPGASRQPHLSLTVPAVDAAERTESWTSSGKLVLGSRRQPPAASLAHGPGRRRRGTDRIMDIQREARSRPARHTGARCAGVGTVVGGTSSREHTR